MEYADHGVVAIAGQNALEAGVNRIKQRLETNRIFFTENCRELISEIRKYRWKKPPRTGEDGPPKPVKKDDHLLDALRYLEMSRPYAPGLPDEDLGLSETQRMMRDDMLRPEKEPQTEFGGIFS